MKTAITDIFDIDFPLFAFSHCRDVVAAVTNAGGMGVLGAAAHTPEYLEHELAWIDAHVGGKPYGVDIVMPASYRGRGEVSAENPREDFIKMIPDGHKRFVNDLLSAHGVAPIDTFDASVDATGLSHEGALKHLEIAFAHPIGLLVNALGPMPADVCQAAHARGIKTAALVGSVEHARRQVAAGIDVIVAQGTEAGGHCGEITTMVLVPDVVDAVEVPVLAAGGIGSGRQVAAALALGAAGVWTGSIWLTTNESNEPLVVKENLLSARAQDAVRSRAITGKPCRQLRTAWTEAFEGPDSPGTLPMPLQSLLFAPANDHIQAAGARELAGQAVGQIVGRMTAERRTADVYVDLIRESLDTVERLHDAFMA
ncbi:nitronate monooxygenase [Mycobacterium conspicuum]|uniref:Monooxygenase n=1 Tax=Mycobacterium conspicuum TaxID=44010 RepID=A0A1X1THX7_9MYCO|nr:nitronate monooxygenase [Mycobacterium conspicuum]ORV44174.1 monooxygenase [Mycobacterium conspicuum]BBZ41023.1 monooxygenase [Mycobacterium conspicuum]